MHMRHRTLWISGAALMAVGLTATAAFAAARSGSAPGSQRASSTVTWSVSSSEVTGGTVKWPLTDSTTGSKISCFGQPVYSFTQRMGLHGRIAPITAISFASCTLPGGTAITLTANNLPWRLMAVSFNPSRNLGVTTGNVAGIDISLSGSGCSGVLDGTAAGANNGTARYQFYNNPDFLIGRNQGNLHIYNVTGCTGLFNNGDAFTMSYTEPFSGLFITSP